MEIFDNTVEKTSTAVLVVVFEVSKNWDCRYCSSVVVNVANQWYYFSQYTKASLEPHDTLH